MSIEQVLMFCTIVLAISACVIHRSTKTIAARLYCRAMGIEYEAPKELPKSPYGIIHTNATDNSWGFCITKDGEIYRSSKYASAPVYHNINGAIQVMNTYEKLEGYKITVLED